MSMTATELRKLASLMLSPEQMAGVLELLADRVEADHKRRAAVAERKRKSRDNSVTVTGHDCDIEAKKEIPHTPLEKTHTQNQPTRAKPSRQAAPFPDDFQLSPENRTIAEKHGYAPAQIDVEIERMRNWSKNATGGKGLKKDWQRFAFNWFTDEKKSHGTRNSNSSKLNDAFTSQRARLVEQFGEPESSFADVGPDF